MNPAIKQPMRDQIAAQIDEFLRSGGRIDPLPVTAKAGDKPFKMFAVSRRSDELPDFVRNIIERRERYQK